MTLMCLLVDPGTRAKRSAAHVLIALVVFLVQACGNSEPTSNEGAEKGIANQTEISRNLDLVVFASYLGGSGEDGIRDVVTDDEGNLYLTGGTESSDFPTTPGAYDTDFNAGACTSCGSAVPMDVFVVKLSPDGELIWSTLLGGPNYDRAYGIALDAEGNVYVGGRAGEHFPTSKGAVQEAFGGDDVPEKYYGRQDPFIAKISSDGSRLIWSSYLGGRDRAVARDIAVDSGGEVAVGITESSVDNPHITEGAFQTQRRGEDGVVVKLAADGASVVFGTYLGGSGSDGETPSVAVDGSGSVYVMMGTGSDDAPVTTGAYDASYNGGSKDMFIAKLSPDGTTLEYGTYLGGAGYEGIETHGIAVDSAGRAHVTFLTGSVDLPTTENAFQGSHKNPTGRRSLDGYIAWDGYVAKLSADGRKLLAASYLGGSEREDLEGIAVGGSGEVVVGGTTFSADFPTTTVAVQPLYGGNGDAFVAKLSPDLTTLDYATFLGGTANDGGRALAVDPRQGVISVGVTVSSDFPTKNAYQGYTFASEMGAYAKIEIP